MSSTTFGTRVGAVIGNTAAYAGHGVALSVQATGRFGRDVAAGAGAQYTIKAAELKARRDAARAAHEARMTKAPVAVAVVVERGEPVPVSV